MGKAVDKSDLVSFRELLVANYIQVYTLTQLLIEAGLISEERKDGQPFSRQSTQHLAGLVLNKTVDVKSYGADRNGRTLGEVFLLDGKNVNLEMVQAGLAEVYRGRPASGLDLEPYWKAEEEAKAAKRGMWEMGDQYRSPLDWRRMHGE